jgi:hypothetical protein
MSTPKNPHRSPDPGQCPSGAQADPSQISQGLIVHLGQGADLLLQRCRLFQGELGALGESGLSGLEGGWAEIDGAHAARRRPFLCDQSCGTQDRSEYGTGDAGTCEPGNDLSYVSLSKRAQKKALQEHAL